jgi:hypothetical protein
VYSEVEVLRGRDGRVVLGVKLAATGSFKDATATIIFFGKSQNQNYDITKNVRLSII